MFSSGHLETHLAEGDRVKFKCPVAQCSKIYSSKANLRRHVDDDHSQTPRSKFKCDQCSNEYSIASSLKFHVRQFHSGSIIKYSCNLCDATFTSKLGRNLHIVAAHTVEKAFKCKECPSKFSCLAGLRAHQFVHTEDRPRICKICSKSFKRVGDLNIHVKHMHSQRTKDFECWICKKYFFTKGALNQHSRTHDETTGMYCCYFCSKKFLTKGHQKRHLKIHTQEKPFICSEESCKYSTSDVNSLKRHHKFRHTQNSTPSRAWTCYFCSKSVSTAYSLEAHLRSHTQEFPFHCTLCRKSFTSKETMQRHVISHTKEKPFRCPHCQKCFSLIGNLKRHILL